MYITLGNFSFLSHFTIQRFKEGRNIANNGNHYHQVYQSGNTSLFSSTFLNKINVQNSYLEITPACLLYEHYIGWTDTYETF
uniref:Uncharacterized protein n=1 Tax=Rhizophora mucronata TaxID=61149 RepID=A0A2P2NCF5_RHIMU